MKKDLWIIRNRMSYHMTSIQTLQTWLLKRPDVPLKTSPSLGHFHSMLKDTSPDIQTGKLKVHLEGNFYNFNSINISRTVGYIIEGCGVQTSVLWFYTVKSKLFYLHSHTACIELNVSKLYYFSTSKHSHKQRLNYIITGLFLNILW